MRYALSIGLAGILSLAMTGSVHAQAYPAKSVRFIVPWPPGGGADTISRMMTPKLSEALGQQVVIDNRAGAAGRTRAVNRVPACGM